MGNSAGPLTIRLGISQPHNAVWYADPNQFAEVLLEDVKIRRFLESRLQGAGLVRVVIYRFRGYVEIKIICLKPAVIVGRKGSEIENLSEMISKMTGGKEVRLRVSDIRSAETSAACIAREICTELKKKRVACRRVIKRYAQMARRAGALGVRIECSGRLSGAEIARREWFQDGAVPRQKFRADLDYSQQDAFTSWGVCGVKVWVYKGDVIGEDILVNLGFVGRERRA